MKVEYDVEIGEDYPDEVQRFADAGYVRRTYDMGDGEVLMDDTRAFGMIAPDVTRLGENGEVMNVRIDPVDLTYDRTEYVDTSTGNQKMWVFKDGDGKQVAVKYDYIELVRDIFDLSLDEVRRAARGAGPVTPGADGEKFLPVLIETDAEWRAIIMPHKSLTD